MLRRYIEYRERALHARDNNRKSLPFEWGLEHVGLFSNGSPDAALREYVSRSLNDSDSFYAYPSTGQYQFDGEVLKFPSAVETPYPENNTVWGRFFPAVHGRKDLAVIVLPQWNCKWDGQAGLCRMLQRTGISALRLSMPYHHYRKPPQTERSEYLISPNIGRTLTASRQAVLDTRRGADWLFEQGHRRVGIVGTSIGSCIAFLAFAHDTRFSTGVFIHVSAFFADVVWSGLSTKHVRYSLEPSVSLEQLRHLWAPISPYPFVHRLSSSNRRMLAISGRFDLTFLPELSRLAYDEFDSCGLPYELTWLPCGHYTMGEFPFSAVAGYRILKFLKLF